MENPAPSGGVMGNVCSMEQPSAPNRHAPFLDPRWTPVVLWQFNIHLRQELQSVLNYVDLTVVVTNIINVSQKEIGNPEQ